MCSPEATRSVRGLASVHEAAAGGQGWRTGVGESGGMAAASSRRHSTAAAAAGKPRAAKPAGGLTQSSGGRLSLHNRHSLYGLPAEGQQVATLGVQARVGHCVEGRAGW